MYYNNFGGQNEKNSYCVDSICKHEYDIFAMFQCSEY